MQNFLTELGLKQMPNLQIDGVTIAEISESVADDLLKLATLHDIGRIRAPGAPQTQVPIMPELKPEPALYTLELEFRPAYRV